MAILTLLLIGGTGYFVYSKVGNSKSTTAIIKKEEISKKDTIDEKNTIEMQTDVPTDKIWEYSFEPALDGQSLNGDNIYVLDNAKQKVDISYELKNNGNTLLIHPPDGGYKKGEKYELNLTNDIKKVTGENVSKNYKMQFITVRDEVESIKLNPNLKKLKKSQAKIIGENKLEIDKNINLVVDDIIVIPTKDYPDGQALKITKIDTKWDSLIVDVKEPEFAELYEKLDIYKSYPITKENIIFNEDLEGVTLESLASKQPTTMVAAARSGGQEKTEFQSPPPSIQMNVDEGIQVKFSNFPLEKNKFVLDGTMKLFSPRIESDIKVSPLNIERFKIVTKTKVNNELKIKNKGETRKKDKNNNITAKIKEKEINLGRILIPIGSTGLIFEGNLLAKFDYSVEGGVETVLYMDYDGISGFNYDKDGVNTIFYPQADFDYGFQGKGNIEGKVGPALNVQLTGLGVIGGGLEAFAGAKANATAVMGENSEDGKYACAKIEENFSVQGSFIVNVLKETVYEWIIKEKDWGQAQKINTCQIIKGFAPINEQKLDAGETIDLKIEYMKHDILEEKYNNEKADMDKVEVSTSTKGVVAIKKTEEGISVKAEDSPVTDKVTITILQEIEGKEYKMDIPVTIKDFKQIQEEKKKKESNDWNGEWTRVSFKNPGTLKISNFNGNTFDLTLEVLSGTNTSKIEGKATVTGNLAILVNQEFKCRLDLTLNKDSITVGQTNNCYEFGGIETHFEGVYKNQSAAAKTPKATLSSLSIIDANSDKDIQKLLGNDYDTLVENMQLVAETRDTYGLEDTLVIEGGVRGLYTFKEGIIVKDPFNHYYIGSIINDGEKVKFYTNDITYKNKLHPVVDEWRQDFADYPVEYIYKKID